MKIHLSKSQTKPGTMFNSFSGFACSNSPFTKGPIRSREELAAKIAEGRQSAICKHCLKLLQEIQN